ncbi:MAG: hypothetical protein K2I08_03975 [Muribaculaceae bacterium]|nr:hypothetical protein [Muribaculaceae bacterium]
MKKLLSTFIILLALVLGSCQETVYLDDIVESKSKSTIIDQNSKVSDGMVSRLRAYNDSLVKNMPASTNIDKGKLKRGITIALEDCWGLLEGASWGLQFGSYLGPNTAVIAASILGPLRGAYCSYKAANYEIVSPDTTENYSSYPTFNECVKAYVYMRESGLDFNEYLPKKISLEIPENKRDLMIAGAKHNLLLENIKEKKLSSISAKTAFEKEIITREEFIILTDPKTRLLFKKAESNNTSENPFDYGTVANEVISLYKEAIQNTSSSYRDVQHISNRYISEITSTNELNEENIDYLTSSICVLASSSEYWQVYDNQ